MNRLAQIRQFRELEIEELARGTGIAEFELNWIERGGAARLSDAVRLIQFFGCSCGEIFPGTERRREIFERIINGQIPSKLYRELDLPEFDTDPRYWFLCVRIGFDPPPLNWSTLKYVFGHGEGGSKCGGSATSRRRSSPSCVR